MRETEIEARGQGRLVLKPSVAAQKRRAARRRLATVTPEQVRASATLPVLRGIVADLLEWLEEGGEASE